MKNNIAYAQNVLKAGGLKDSPKYVTFQMMQDIIHNLINKHQEEIQHRQMMNSFDKITSFHSSNFH